MTEAGPRVRVAYLVCSYTLPDQVMRLLRVLRDGSPDAVLASHHDDRSGKLDEAGLADAGILRILPPSAVQWGTFSQLEMVLRCMRELLDRADFDWLVLLSGQDYPIRPLPDIERFLAGDGHDGFIERRALAAPRPWRRAPDEFSARYLRRYVAVPAGLERPVRAIARRIGPLELRTLGSRRLLGLPLLRGPYSPALRPYHGSDWFTLSRRCVQRACTADRRLLHHHRRTLIPTESFVHTVLYNDASLKLSGDTRRYTSWDEPPAPRPRILRLADLEPMLASGLDFARKFDSRVDAAVLDAIDRRVHRE